MMSSRPLLPRNPLKSVRFMGTAALSVALLAGCDENGNFSLAQPNGAATASTAGSTKSTKLVERDVESPDVFSVTDDGLWDGRPSLGGIWVAHPDVEDPERVIMRNQDNGKFVIGALFRRERNLPGPILQVSSDAAAALGMLAGSPAELNITALRREETEELVEVAAEELPAEEAAPLEDVPTTIADPVPAPQEVTATSLDPIAAAGAAIEAAPETPPIDAAIAEAIGPEDGTELAASTVREPAAPRGLFALTKPSIEVGSFATLDEANSAAQQLNGIGILPTVAESDITGVPQWRVVVGPATTRQERRTLMKAVKAEGYTDAFIVAN